MGLLKNVSEWLSGKKTYLLVLLALLVLLGNVLGYFSETVTTELLSVLGFSSIAAVRSAIKK